METREEGEEGGRGKGKGQSGRRKLKYMVKWDKKRKRGREERGKCKG